MGEEMGASNAHLLGFSAFLLLGRFEFLFKARVALSSSHRIFLFAFVILC